MTADRQMSDDVECREGVFDWDEAIRQNLGDASPVPDEIRNAVYGPCGRCRRCRAKAAELELIVHGESDETDD